MFGQAGKVNAGQADFARGHGVSGMSTAPLDQRWQGATAGEIAVQIVAAERQTPQGLLTWRLALHTDGNFAGRGALPTLIEWRGAHPTDSLPASPVGLASIHLAGLPEHAVRAMALRGVKCDAAGDAGQAMLRLTLDTPLGRVTLSTDD